jgi:amino acid adenylation domain-containing protein
MDSFESLASAGRAASIPEQVSVLAALKPDATALSAGAASMSYGELDRRAGQLAAYLAEAKVGPEVPVGICLKRSFDQIVAILAVLKSGGAFVPLDPSWPIARVQRLLDDAQAPIVVAEPEVAAQVATRQRRAIHFDRDAAVIDRCGAIDPIERQPEQLAYIIYTSGSTGEPKGVEIADRNLLNLLDWHRSEFEIGPADRASYLAGLAFDAAVWEVWPYLCAGATVVIAPEEVRSSWRLLQAWLIEQKITMAFASSSLAEPMIGAPWPSETALRYLLTGAEALHRAPVGGLGFTLVNNYGPTECAVVATSSVIPSEMPGMPPIGRPISNVRVHLLDGSGRPVGPGETGEIYIGGAAVGRGYRNRPELTAERFRPDPFSAAEGSRLYRTGDLGLRASDGQILFRGRIDDQEKIRGHRIEPDEIVHALNRHPRVRASAAMARGLGEHEKGLVAYIVAGPAGEPSAEELRAHLADQLPDYMIPGRFVRLDALPLTANGKLDKRALPEPTAQNALGQVRFEGPRTRTEQTLSSIFAEVLGGPRIGVDDSFFLSGGHSLLGTQVVLRARDVFGVELTLRHLFETQTVARLAQKIEQLLIEKVSTMSEEEVERRLAV